VSVELISDLSWFGNEGESIICIGVSSNLNVPSWGLFVVKGCGETFAFRLVSVLKRVDFPEFGNPTRTICMSDFFIPSCFPFPDFLCFAKFSLEDKITVVSQPGVANIVHFKNQYIPIQDSVIDSLRILIKSKVKIDPHPYLKIGDKIAVKEGPLKGG